MTFYNKQKESFDMKRVKIEQSIQQKFRASPYVTNLLSFLSFLPYDLSNKELLNPLVNHHGLNRNNTNYQELKKHLENLVQSEKSVLHVPFHVVTFKELDYDSDLAVEVVSVDPSSDLTREKPFVFHQHFSQEKHTSVITPAKKKSFETFLKREDTDPKLFFGLIDGLHRATIFFDLLQSNWKRFSTLFLKIECNVVEYAIKREFIKKPPKDHLANLRSFSKLITENNTKTIGHTITDGFMTCIQQVLQGDDDGTYYLCS